MMWDHIYVSSRHGSSLWICLFWPCLLIELDNYMVGALPSIRAEKCCHHVLVQRHFARDNSRYHGHCFRWEKGIICEWTLSAVPLEKGKMNRQPPTATQYPKTSSEFHFVHFSTKYALLKLSSPDSLQLGVTGHMGFKPFTLFYFSPFWN